MENLYAPNCIYTIRHSKFLKEFQKSKEINEFEENLKWVKGLEIFQEAEGSDLIVPILFAPAEDISRGVTHWAALEGLHVEGGKTKVRFSSLRRLGRKLPLSHLQKLSNGQPLSDNHIHPYVPCITPKGLPRKKARNELPDKIARKQITNALGLIDQGAKHAFAESTGYDVIWEGRTYPPKAVIGIAAKLVTGTDYKPKDFSGGVGSKCFRLLKEAGFEIIAKGTEPTYPDEVLPHESFPEGYVSTVKVNRYERSAQAREKCIGHYGAICMVCTVDFGKRYGAIGIGFIHVHHLKPISEIKEGYKINPIKDLRPVCPNCHAMLHRKSPPLSIDELKQMISCNA